MLLFECVLSCPSNRSFGLHRLYIIRVRALLFLESLFRAFIAFILFECGILCPSNHSFRPSAPLYYSSADSLAPRTALSGLHRFYIIQVWASLSLESFFQAFSAFILFECGLSCPSICSFRPAAPWYYSSVGSLVLQIALLGLHCFYIT
jgi:hypothetical protein